MVIIIVAIAVLSTAVLVQFQGGTNSPVRTSTSGSSSTISSTQQGSSSTSSSDGRTPSFIAFSQDPSSILATPSVTMNYTVIVSQFDQTTSHVTLSAVSTVPGVTFSMKPNEFTFFGTQEVVVFGISVAQTVNSSILPVKITASTANGSISSTYDIKLSKALIVVTSTEALRPSTLHVSAGQTVTWLNLVELDDDGNGFTHIALMDGSAASLTMVQDDVWTHKFDKPGTYTYQVTVTGYNSPSGVVVVS